MGRTHPPTALPPKLSGKVNFFNVLTVEQSNLSFTNLDDMS